MFSGRTGHSKIGNETKIKQTVAILREAFAEDLSCWNNLGIKTKCSTSSRPSSCRLFLLSIQLVSHAFRSSTFFLLKARLMLASSSVLSYEKGILCLAMSVKYSFPSSLVLDPSPESRMYIFKKIILHDTLLNETDGFIGLNCSKKQRTNGSFFFQLISPESVALQPYTKMYTSKNSYFGGIAFVFQTENVWKFPGFFVTTPYTYEPL